MSTTLAPVDTPEEADHLDTSELVDGLATVRSSPATDGTVEMVVARPAEDRREVLETGTLTARDGLVGDDWRRRSSGADIDAQLTLINARFLDLVSRGDRARWPWAGDQLVVDLDLSADNLATGDRLRIGTALVEVTPKPHTGCIKFVGRFGVDAQRFANDPDGRNLRLRGMYVKVVEDGTVRPGDEIAKVERS